MQLNELYLKNYRNLKEMSLSFDNQINIFIGQNGQGKTNLLESIYFMSLTKSFKTSKLNELVNFNENGFYLKAKVIKNEFNYSIECDYTQNKKQIKINNNNESKFKDVIGLLNAILFVPEDLQLLKGSPKNRRKLLDIELSKVYPKYLVNLSSYYHVLKQRNSYLKEENIDEIIIDTLDVQLDRYGKEIYNQRITFIEELSKLTNNFYYLISGISIDLNIVYSSTVLKDNLSIYDGLKKVYQKDKIFQQTTIGIHRDDFIIYIDGKNAADYASQGEQRTIVLAIKLGLVEYIYEKTQEYPILLLDDVMSELDVSRQENLIKYLNMKVQTFISTTNTDNLGDNILLDAKLFNVNSGEVKEAGINE